MRENTNGVTIYTIVADDGHVPYPFYARISTPEARAMGKRPSEYGYFSDPGEASQETKIAYGKDIIYVTPADFEEATIKPM